MVLVGERFYRGGIGGLVFVALFAWGTLAAAIQLRELNERADRYERLLRNSGIDHAST